MEWNGEFFGDEPLPHLLLHASKTTVKGKFWGLKPFHLQNSLHHLNLNKHARAMGFV